ncbi:MAG: hypothetical protein ACREPB_05530, partial [Arenimonas sp.]
VVLDKFIAKDDYGLGLCRWTSNVLSADLNNGINEHSIDVALETEFNVKRGYQIIAFRLDKSPGETDTVSLGGGLVDSTNADDYANSGKYFYITMTAKKARL